MSSCSPCCGAEEQFDRKRVERDLRRFRKRGPEITTRLMLEELRRWPLEGLNLLDIGGGIGVIGKELAGNGVAGVTMVDASSAFLEVARQEVAPRFASRPAQFFLGDFAEIAATVPEADIVTLDRVVCCYADGEALLREAAAKTRRLLAFSYPRNRWLARMMIALDNFMRRIKGKSFRAFVHPPERMEQTLEAAGLALSARRKSVVWALAVYRRHS